MTAAVTDGINSCLTNGGFGNTFLGSAFVGTSFAAPHVAGLSALLLEKESGFNS